MTTHKAEVVQVEASDGLILDGLYYGAERIEIAFIFLHGLTDSAFGKHAILEPFVGHNIGALYFNNRGNNFVAKLKKKNLKKAKGYESVAIGQTHEVFSDCVYDIEGAISHMKKRGAKKIYLVGHSTGCQKSIYHASKNPDVSLQGIVLLCPLSDYAYALQDKDVLKKATKVAQNLAQNGNEHQIMPTEVWPELVDAQRFLSLYTPTSEEEIFTYAQESVTPETYQKVTHPILAIFAGSDEYADRSPEALDEWFRKMNNSRHYESAIIAGSIHNLKDKEQNVAEHIKSFLEKTLDI